MARKPLDTAITLRLPQDMHAELTRQSEREGIPLAAHIRRILQAHLSGTGEAQSQTSADAR